VVVTVNGQPSNPVDFTVTTPIVTPTISGLSPFAGPVGTVVTLTGSNLGTAQGTSTVTFNGTPASPTSWSPSSIVVPVPSGATTGPVVVTVGGQASNAVVFTVTTVSASRELWVDKNSLGGPCSDSRSAGSVTRTTPYCTLWAAISHVVPGDFVHVRGGTYVESLRPITAGTSSQWIRFAAEPGETVTLQGGGDVTSGIQLFVREATPSFNEISGFHVMNMSHNCVMVDSVPDVRLINLEVSGCGGSGAVELHQTQRVTLEGSRIHDNATTGWTSAVDLFECGDGNVVRGNWIWSNSDNPSGNADTEGHGITMDLCGSAGGALIENNVIWNNEGWGISIYRSDGATIRNNTLYQNGIRSGGEIMSLGNRVAIHNNILVPRSGRIALNMRYTSSGYAVDPATLQEDFDLIGAPTGAAVLQWGDSVGTLARYRSENPRGWGVMTQAADPLFVNPSAADFHLTAGSPARDTGDDTHAPSIDIEGRPRPSGPATDRGAYELGPG
jgi:parallel beta-helix repeat protein